MALQIREATMDDVTDLTNIVFYAFYPENPIERITFPKGLTPSVFEASKAEKTQELNDAESKHTKHVVISYVAPLPEGPGTAGSQTHADSASVNNPGRIIAYARWRFFVEEVPQMKWNQPRVVQEGDLGSVEEVNYDMAKEFLGKLRQHRLDGVKVSKYAYLSVLATHPSYRGLGAGSQLLEWGIKEAERHKLECWLQASPSGLPVYRRMGFEDISSFFVDVRKYTNQEDGPYVTILMRRRLNA